MSAARRPLDELTDSVPSPDSDRSVAILLIDDEVKNLIALETILEAPGYRLVRAQTAEQALLALMNEDFAAIVLDVQMPDMSGIELARLIKQRKKTEHIPVLFVTAYFQEEEHVVQGYDVGGVDYLTKPVNPSVLRSKVAVFVDLFCKRRALADLNNAMAAEIAEREKAEEALRSANVELAKKNIELEQRTHERDLRIRAEAAQERSLLLAEASSILSGSFEAEQTFPELARLAADRLADCCFIDIAGPDDSTDILAMAHREGAEELREAVCSCNDRRANVASVMQAGCSEVHDRAGSRDWRHAPVAVVDLDALAWIVAPLQARGRVLGTLSLYSSSRERFEEAEISLVEELAERAGIALDNSRLYREAREARETAEAANRAKDHFLAMLSHELRTPLSPVLHAAAYLHEQFDCPPPVRNSIEVIKRNVQLEARLIDDLLDVARIRSGKLRLIQQAVEVHSLVRQAIDICEQEIKSGRLRLNLNFRASRSWLFADPARIQQIFWNIIINAIRHTPPGGSITIQTANDPEGAFVKVSVIDTGSGIDPSRVDQIFDAFQQADQSRVGGLGLGLAICKALTVAHGGSIKVYSQGLTFGSTFTISLPVVAATSLRAPEESQPATVETTGRLRLLLVEDHLDTAETLERLLVKQGYEVRLAASVSQALRAAEEFEYDLLISDIGLPDGTGMDLVQHLARLRPDRAVPAVALSGFCTQQDIEHSKAAGFSDHLTKPIDFRVLNQTLKRIAAEVADSLQASGTRP
jgi:signal transduction histidine kinase/DNA-binding response OmpR family regulator